MLLFFVSGVWTSKVCYTEDELRGVHDVHKVLGVIQYRGHASAELMSEVDAIAGNCQFIIVLCKVCQSFIIKLKMLMCIMCIFYCVFALFMCSIILVNT